MYLWKEAECFVNVTFWLGELLFDLINVWFIQAIFALSSLVSLLRATNSFGKLIALGAKLILELLIFIIFLYECALNTPAYSRYSNFFFTDCSFVWALCTGKFDSGWEFDKRNLLWSKFFYDWGRDNIFRTYLKSGVCGKTLFIWLIFLSSSSFFISTICPAPYK